MAGSGFSVTITVHLQHTVREVCSLGLPVGISSPTVACTECSFFSDCSCVSSTVCSVVLIFCYSSNSKTVC